MAHSAARVVEVDCPNSSSSSSSSSSPGPQLGEGSGEPTEGVDPGRNSSRSPAATGQNRVQAQVGGRLADFAEVWQERYPNSQAARTLREGVLIQFAGDKPPTTNQPIAFPTSAKKECQLVTVVQDLLKKRAVEPVANTHSAGFYSRLFTVPKSSGDLRPVIDLSTLNRFIWCPHFQMETAVSIRRSIRPGEWVTSVDLSDAYLHVPLAPSIRKYFRFMVRGQVYQFRVLPFGLCTAPREFTKLLQPVLQELRSTGIRVHAYLDDWAIRSPSETQGNEDTTTVIQLLVELGWLINFPKSELSPRQRFGFVGLFFDTLQGLVAPQQKFQLRMHYILRELKSHPGWTARKLHSLVGLLQFLAPLVHRGRMHLRVVQRWVRARWTQSTGQWSDVIQTDRELVEMITWWTQDSLYAGVPLQPPQISATLCTDSSTTGWGAHLGDEKVSGVWSEQDRSLHINMLEMKAVQLALVGLAGSVRRQVVRLCCDNSTVVTYLRKEGGTKADHLTDLAIEILSWCDQNQVTLVPVHLAGAKNVTADSLSRRGVAQPGEWEMQPSLLQAIFDKWGTPLVDMFATYNNAKLPIFVSPMPDERAWETDALSLDWAGLGLVYAYPPGPVLPLVLEKVSRAKGTQVILIAPNQPLRPWYPDLRQLSVQDPWDLPLEDWPLRQKVPGVRGWVYHENPQVLNLAAWLLSGDS